MLAWLKLFQSLGMESSKKDAHALGLDPAVLMKIKEKTRAEKNQIPPDISLQKAKIVVFDLETTGFNPYSGDEIISVSAVTIQNGHIKKKLVFDHLTNPHSLIPFTITRLTGITNEMVNEVPSVLWVLNEFLDYAQGSILAAHQAGFDLAFVNLKLKQFCRSRITHPVIDTWSMAKKILTGEEDCSLDSLIKIYNICPAGRHTSIGDAMMTAEILIKMLNQLFTIGVETFQDLNNYLYRR